MAIEGMPTRWIPRKPKLRPHTLYFIVVKRLLHQSLETAIAHDYFAARFCI